jgi:hypothetical protein
MSHLHVKDDAMQRISVVYIKKSMPIFWQEIGKNLTKDIESLLDSFFLNRYR